MNTKEVLCLGGPWDGRRATIDEGMHDFRVALPGQEPHSTDFRQKLRETHYRCHRLYENDEIYHVAKLADEQRPVLSLLMAGYQGGVS